MKIIRFLLILTVITAVIIMLFNKNNQYKPNSEEAAVLAVFEQMQQAMIDKDMETLDAIIKDDTKFKHMSGKVQTKAEYFAEIENGTLNYYKYKINDLNITVSGNSANLTAATTLTAKVYGISGSWTLNTNAYFEKINGKWIYCNKN